MIIDNRFVKVYMGDNMITVDAYAYMVNELIIKDESYIIYDDYGNHAKLMEHNFDIVFHNPSKAFKFANQYL